MARLSSFSTLDQMTSRDHIHSTADVADSAVVPSSTRVWHYAQIRDDVVLGENSIIGRGAYIGTGVVMGDNCKIQNYALVYEPARLADGVFVGPAVVFTNDHFPRAINADGTLKSADDWHAVGVEVGTGASIGARSVCVAPVRIGAWALVGAGATVIRDVPDFALVVGSPARRVGWVGHAGEPLTLLGDGLWECPRTGRRYRETEPDRLESIPSEENA
jgi:acetyltransferase-like isoleucine patch superfamily enzyme